MNNFAEWFIIACWTIFGIFWLVSAFFVKRTVERHNWVWQRIVVLAGIAVIIALRYTGRLSTVAGPPFWQYTPAIGFAADLVTLGGLALLLWARFSLGANWSADVTFKENHELIEHGPYRYVRHPIYSGLLLLIFGGAILSGRGGGFGLLVVFFFGVLFRMQQEERLLTKHFPQAYPSYKARVKALIPFVF